MDLVQTLSAAGGAATGGAVALWFSKLMLQRLINQYDARHEAHDRRLETVTQRVFDALTDIKTKLAALEVRAAEISLMRADTKEALTKVAVLGNSLEKVQSDLNEAHRRIRSLKSVGGKGE